MLFVRPQSRLLTVHARLCHALGQLMAAPAVFAEIASKADCACRSCAVLDIRQQPPALMHVQTNKR